MEILVTGGAGFIGSSLVDRLVERGHQVTVIDDFNDFYDPAIKRGNLAQHGEKVRVVEADIRDREAVDALFTESNFECVVHLAARAGVRPSIDDPALYLSTNVDGTFHLLEACRENGVRRFLFASSSSVYGINKKTPFAEGDLIERTISPYAASKLAGEQLCSNYAHLHGLEVLCMRFFTVYGPRQRPDLAISKFVRLIDEGKPIDQYGDGSTGRDYTYIDDIVDGIEAGLNLPELDFQIVNLGGSHVIRLHELIKAVEAAMGQKARINQLPEQPGDVPLTSADVSKAHDLLGYKPQVEVLDGVRRYVEWFRKHLA